MVNKSIAKFIAFIIIALIPVVFFVYFKNRNNFSNSSSPRPMWPIDLKNVNGKMDTIYHQVPYFSATNANGVTISTDEMIGNVSVVEFFFAQCPSICPIMNQQMERVFTNLSRNNNFKIFSYTIDPDRDSLSSLTDYASKHNADLSKWYFLRANQQEVFNFGRNGLKIPVDIEDSEVGFLHSERFVLIDWNRNIRGYYMGTDSVEVNKMMHDIVLLLSEKELKEKKKRKKFKL
jgi:protein SCO1/2